MPVDLFLIQHGVTDWNVKRWSQGHSDTPLNEAGRRQAELLADRLMGERFDAIYSSDMRRAYESIEPFAARQGLAVHKDWRLREGRWERHKKREEVPLLDFPVASETSDDMQHRIVQCTEEIVTRHPKGRILVMSHGAVLARLFYYFEQTSLWPFPPFQARKCAINHFRRDDRGRWSCVLLNDDRFLREHDLVQGHIKRPRRRRSIVYRTGAIGRMLVPPPLHPLVGPRLKSLLNDQPDFSADPYGKQGS